MSLLCLCDCVCVRAGVETLLGDCTNKLSVLILFLKLAGEDKKIHLQK